jgi:hypothetical protein
MSNGSNCCYLIFDRNSGSFLRSESSEIGNWVMVECIHQVVHSAITIWILSVIDTSTN